MATAGAAVSSAAKAKIENEPIAINTAKTNDIILFIFILSLLLC